MNNDSNKDKDNVQPIRRRKRKRKRRMSSGKKITIVILTLLLFCIAAGATYALSIMGKVSDSDFNDTDLGIDKSNNSSSSNGDNKIKNILLLGIDQSEGDVGRSDAIMIATFDSKHKKLKVTSLSRDSYVNIDGHGYDKLTHAYAFGKEELAIKTINQTFGLDITDYAKVNFTELEEIIDSLGGIELTINNEEVEFINKYIRDLSADKNITPTYINSSGKQAVTGLQATAYSRIRATSGGDDKRTERHRMVLTAIFNKVSNVGVLKLPSVVNSILPNVKTSLSTSEIISIGTKVLNSGMSEIEQLRFPLSICSKPDTINGIDYTTFDEPLTKSQIQDYIYRDIKPTE
ncbi:MAG: LCP family protein [Clostridium sp.]|uniref:LCP family protein n=1 Tax=Clostridium sp. TaxID=1506 RepID=UPI0030629C9F